MMKYEFEKIAGYEVSWEDYNNIIEPMYNATDLDKFEFVKLLNKKRFAQKTRKQYKAEMKKIAEHLHETCDHYTDYEAIEKLEKLINEWQNRIGAYGYHLEVRYTYEHLGDCRGCTYPVGVEFYSKNYNKMDYIAL